MDQHKLLTEQIERVYRRWKRMILFKGTSKALIATIGALLAVFLIDTVFQLGSISLLILLGVVALVSLATLYVALIRPLLRAPAYNQIARYIEEKNPDLEDRLISAVELGGVSNPTVSTQILQKLLDDTRFHVEGLNLPKFIPAKAATVWGSFAAAISVFLAVFVISNLDFFTMKSNRIFTPWKIPTLKARPSLHVTPGNTRIPIGSPLEIKAEINGFESDKANLYFTTNDSSWTKVEMDQESTDGFVYNFFNLDQETRYYVRIEDELSDIYSVNVYDAPKIKRIELTYRFPDYTGLKGKKELDGGDIWAPEGTTVGIAAIVDKPVTEAKVILGGSKELHTAIRADTIVTATLEVMRDSFYKIHVTGADGLSNHLPPEYYIHALPDQSPVLTIEKPGRDVKATMLEEVPVRVHVEDDYGISSLRLNYTVNEQPLQTTELPVRKSAKIEYDRELSEVQEYSAEHLFYLEDLNVQPGDFLTFYVEVTDNHRSRSEVPITSEIFFIEVRPFEQSFFRPLSQGQGGGGGGARGPGRLSQTQKDIIVATWKTNQNREKLSAVELKKSIDIIIESQANLKDVTQSTLFQMQQRSILSGRSGSGDISKHYSTALDAMERALEQLRNHDLTKALGPEKESLAELLAAEAFFNESQLQQSQAGAAGQSAALEELAQLFEQEMDNLKNKYETNEQNLQRRNDEEVSEALDKIKELARRQQQLNQRLRDLNRKNLPPEEKKRRIQELRRQQEQMRRETNQLAREMQQQQQNSGMPRDLQDDLKRATSDMNNASNNMRQDNTELAAAKGQQALNRLQRLEEQLKRNQKQSLRRRFESIQEEMRRTAEAQEKLTKEIEQLAQRDSGQEGEETSEAERQKAQEDQKRIQENFQEIEREVKSLSNNARKARNEASRELGEFSKELQDAQIEEKMADAAKLLEEDRLNSASQAGRDIEKLLENMNDKLAKVRGSLAETEEEKLDVAMDQTRQLRENIESLQRQMQKSQEQGPQSQNQQELASDSNSQQVQAGPGENRRPNQELDPTKMDWMNNQLAQARKDLDLIQEAARIDSSLSEQAQRLSQNLESVLRTFRGGDENRLKLIEAQVLIPLKSFEAELAQKIDLIKNKEKLFLARDEEIPPEYQKLVEKYYEALSKTK